MIEKIHIPLRYLLGLKFNKKIIIFESDDWGSIRMPNKEVREKFIKRFPEIQNNPFYYYDTIASDNDLTALYEILSKYKDLNGNYPCITANTIMTNPDFHAISKNNYEKFIYERFDKTISRYYSDNAVNLWKEGINYKLFYPQLHGREHVHALQWLNELKNGNKDILHAFKHNTYSVPLKVKHGYQRNNLESALNISGLENENKYHENYIIESYKLFEKYFGYPSKSFTATAYIWNENHEEILSNLGIKLIQGIGYQYCPVDQISYKKVFHYTGQRNKFDQYYLVRNSFFEPSLQPQKDWLSECLRRIDLAFKFKKPAIIGTHRVNFIGSIEENNRTKNLKIFDQLLKKILLKWPDVEFYNSCMLIEKITTGYKDNLE